MIKKQLQSTFFSLVLLTLVLLLAGCSKSGTNSTTPSSETPQTKSAPQASPLTGFEKDLQYVRNSQFRYVWVFSRKDGKPLDKDDAAYLRTNAPQVIDWVTTDDGKKVIAGTNFNLEEGNLGLLKKRFVAEDYSGK
jgi:hypothetical protein